MDTTVIGCGLNQIRHSRIMGYFSFDSFNNSRSSNNSNEVWKCFKSLSSSLPKTNPDMLEHITVETFLDSIMVTNGSPAFALIKCMFKNIYFIPFGMWGAALVEILELQRDGFVYSGVFHTVAVNDHYADARTLVQQARNEAPEFHFKYGYEMQSWLDDKSQVYTKHAYMRPLGVVAMVLGIDDENGPHLFKVDPTDHFFGLRQQVLD